MTDTSTTHIGSNYISKTDPKNDTIIMEPVSHQNTCETTGKILGYRDSVKMDPPVWKNSMCNELGRLCQGWKSHAGTDTIEFIFHKDKPKDRRATFVRVVCNIQPQNIETHRTRLTVEGDLIDYPGEVSTPTLDLTNMKLHINSAISDVKSRYMCMEVKVLYLNNQMDRDKYIMIQLSMIPQEFVEK